MNILAALPAGANLFSSPPSNLRINDPLPSRPPPPLPLPVRKRRLPPPPPPPSPSSPHTDLKSEQNGSRYYKPVSPGILTSAEGGRAIIIGESGVSYLLPNAPFEFQFSYSETPKAKPLALREPAFLPFAPPQMSRPWTGKAPLLSKKEKDKKKKIPIFQPLGENSFQPAGEAKEFQMSARQLVDFGRYVDTRSREDILGEPLGRAEVAALIKPYLSTNRQVNLGRDGLTHNMLELVHSHWRRQEICKVRCRGVPTVDMDNVCYHLEKKTGGMIIRRTGGIVYLYRGRNYNPRIRPHYPVMLWKPATPVYPKLIQEAPEGLTKEAAEELRREGQNLLPICRLAKNGIYLSLVKDVREAFELSYLVKVNCQGLEPSDYKKIGAKLKDLVPCVLLSFDKEQILMWRGKDWKSRYHTPFSLIPNISKKDDGKSSYSGETGKGESANKVASSSKILSLWKRALESNRALLLDETELSPDSLLDTVEGFEGLSQAAEHAYLELTPSGGGANADVNEVVTEARNNVDQDENVKEDDEDICVYEELESLVPFGSLPIDSLAERLHREI